MENSLRERAEEECLKILGEPFYSACDYLPRRLNEAIIKLFITKEDNEIVREAYTHLHEKGWV